MTADYVTSAIERTCGEWADLADALQEVADVGAATGSQLDLDNQAAVVGDQSKAIARYVQERAWNAARMLRHLYRVVFDTEPGRLHLDFTVMYPLMRATLEDTAALTWLLSPNGQNERLTRSLRLLRDDSLYLAENHAKLAVAGAGVSGVPPALAVQLEQHMLNEVRVTKEHFEALAKGLGLDSAELARRPSTSEPIKSVYGEESVAFVAWKLLSDLSHFSFTMMRHMAAPVAELEGSPLSNVTLVVFATEVNRGARVSADHLRRAVALP